MRLGQVLAALLIITLVTSATAEEVVMRNDTYEPPGDIGLEADWAMNEEGGAVLTSPCNGSIVAIQIGWASQNGLQPPSLEQAIWVYSDAGGFPTPGTPLLQLEGPVLNDRALNEFRYIDEDQTIPINIPISAGESIYVTLEFANPTDVNGGTAALFHDMDTCSPGRNVLYGYFMGLGWGWYNLCDIAGTGYGISGNLVIRAIVDCQEPTGACCTVDGLCLDDIEQGDCQEPGQTFFLNQTCAEVTCPDPVGACCNGTGGCLDNITENDCYTVYSGIYAGNGTTCDSQVCALGACCLPDGSCTDVIEIICLADSGEFQGVGTSCATTNCPQPTGACCIGENCSLQLETNCLSFNGTWLGPDTSCDPNPCLSPDWCLGDMNCSGGSPDFADITYFAAAVGNEAGWIQYYRDNNAGEDPPCPWLLGDYNGGGVEFSDITPFANSVGQPCIIYNP